MYADERGFSLLEVLVASTILTVALVSLAQVLALATALNASAGRTTVAAVLASQRVETLRALSWDSLERQTGTTIEYLDRAGAEADVAEDAAYTRESVVAPLADDPSNLLGIRVVVRSVHEMVALDTTIAHQVP